MRAAGDALADVRGLRVGHAVMPGRPTGCTVVLCEGGARGGVDVRGAAPGTRETDLLQPAATVDVVHAVLLAGGSAYGLAAADGVMRWLDQRGVGVTVGPARVPIVPAAVLFDLWLGDSRIRPDADCGVRACEDALDPHGLRQGSCGAGAGASVGKLFGAQRTMRGGLGQASVRVVLPGRVATVSALVAVNAVGDVFDPACGRIVAGARADDGSPLDTVRALLAGEATGGLLRGGGGATTLGIVATDVALDKARCARLATLAHDGLARTIRPVHTAMDGDTVFALATAALPGEVDPMQLTALGAAAAQAMAEAVLNAVRLAADGADGLPPSAAQVSAEARWAGV